MLVGNVFFRFAVIVIHTKYRSHDGYSLFVSSTDGYCTMIGLSHEELGTIVRRISASEAKNMDNESVGESKQKIPTKTSTSKLSKADSSTKAASNKSKLKDQKSSHPGKRSKQRRQAQTKAATLQGLAQEVPVSENLSEVRNAKSSQSSSCASKRRSLASQEEPEIILPNSSNGLQTPKKRRITPVVLD